MKSFREENYLKAIYQISESGDVVSITEIAHTLGLKPPTVLEKLNVLKQKKLISYNKTQGAKLTTEGKSIAVNIIRRHRIWETYLFKVLKFGWSEVHEIAEQLEHVDAEKLIDRVYEVCGKPDFDPHGDPIPNKQGKMPEKFRRPILESVKGCRCVVLGVGPHNDAFLEHLSKLNIKLNDKLIIEERVDFDNTILARTKDKELIHLSEKVAKNLYVSCIKEGCLCKGT